VAYHGSKQAAARHQRINCGKSMAASSDIEISSNIKHGVVAKTAAIGSGIIAR